MMEIGRKAVCPMGHGTIIGLLIGYAVVSLDDGNEWCGPQRNVKCDRLPGFHAIVCGNLGHVYRGHDESEAKQVYDQYVSLSLAGVGRAGHENVVWFVDDDVRCEHIGKLIEPGSSAPLPQSQVRDRESYQSEALQDFFSKPNAFEPL